MVIIRASSHHVHKMCNGPASGTSATQHNGPNLTILTHLPLWHTDPFTLTNSFLGFPSFKPVLTCVSFLEKLSPPPFLWLTRVFSIFQKPDPIYISLMFSKGSSEFPLCLLLAIFIRHHYLLYRTVRSILKLTVFFSWLTFKFLKSMDHELSVHCLSP